MASYYVRSGAAGAADGTSWTDAYTTLVTALTGKAAGDIFYVAADHAETAAAAKTLTSPGTAVNPCYIYCVDHTGSVPPVSADLRTTGSVTTTGTNAITFAGGHAKVYGLIFSAGTGASPVSMGLGSTNGSWVLDSCQLQNPTTSTNSNFLVGSQTIPRAIYIKLKNTTFTFGHSGCAIILAGARFVWEDTPSAIAGATQPLRLFDDASSGASGDAWIEGVDLSAIASGQTLVAAINAPKTFTFKDCLLSSNVIIAAAPQDPAYAETFLLRSDGAGTNYRNEKYQYMGTQTVETTIIRTGGASDGTTSISSKITTTVNSNWFTPFEAFPIAIWNSTTASNVTATLEGVWNVAALPNNDEFWFDFEYQGSASGPLGTFKRGTKADGLAAGAALTASTEAWDSLVTARANSTVYALGDVRKVASNSGRIFFCTTAGTSAGSEPAGYASAVDGGSVTDNTAVFRAGMRFKLAVTATSPQPQAAGYMYLYPKAAKVSSTFYIDPKVTLA